MVTTNTAATSRKTWLALALGLLAMPFLIGAEFDKAAPAKEVEGMPLLFHEDFSDAEKAMARFEFTDPKAWQWKDLGGPAGGDSLTSPFASDGFLSLSGKSKYAPPVRSPLNIAWVKELKAGPFVIEAKLRSTVRDYGHRDVCLFFGGVDPSHFFYVHIAKVADPHANSIFLVNGEPRVSVATKTTKGTDWDDAWHTVRVVRQKSGQTEVFFDGQSIMTSDRPEFPQGRVGVGSFDDTADFTEVTVWGEKGE